MITSIQKKFEKLLKDNGFKKYKKYYFRLLNRNVFQTIGFVYKGGLCHLTFFSDILDINDCLEEHLKVLELVHDGYDISQLINQENICNTKEEAMAILNEEIMTKLNSLVDIKIHISFFEKEMFTDQGRVCFASYLYYLYNNDYEKAEIEYSKILALEIESITSWRLDSIIWKERRTKNEFVLEQLYKQYLVDQKVLEKIKRRESFIEYFNNNYQKNKKIIENYYGEKLTKQFEVSYDQN